MKQGGWIFISHSHQDILKVRRIRNRLEELGLEPLMFYLKCLSDENEIEELIKREIDERDWFIYADSRNARGSKWVKTERDYIESLTGKNVFTIDLDGDLDEQLAMIEHISRQMKVYIAYTRQDTGLALRIRDKLVEKDMMVLTDRDISSGTVWQEEIETMLSDASHDGFVLALLTEHSEESRSILRELDTTLRMGGRIIPVYVGRVLLSEELLSLIGHINGIRLPEQPCEEDLDRVVAQIIHDVEFIRSDFRDTVGYRSARSITLPNIARIDEMTFFECDNLERVTIPDSVVYITSDAFEDHPDILVRCHAGSYAEGYCQRMGIRYEIIED